MVRETTNNNDNADHAVGADMSDLQQTPKNSHNGGPSEEQARRIRRGQIDWIVGLEKATEFKSWVFKFKMGAHTYLSKEVYPDAEERRFAWVNALIRASSLGKFQELCDQVELLDAAGYRCEKLLEKIEKRYLPVTEVERKRATSQYLSFSRGKATLLESLKQLQHLLLECRKYGYYPGEETQIAKLEDLILPEERSVFRINVERCFERRPEFDSDSRIEKIMEVIEALGKDQEDIRKGGSSGPRFAGGSWRKGNDKKGPRRKGHPERREEKSQGSKKPKQCGRCGKECPFARGEPKEKCFAFEKECRKCSKIGHFESVCKTKVANTAVIDETPANF